MKIYLTIDSDGEVKLFINEPTEEKLLGYIDKKGWNSFGEYLSLGNIETKRLTQENNIIEIDLDI